MDELPMCRICLVEDVKMYSLISANLQELYERLTKIPFVTKDKRPVQVCYLCHARLQNCHRLQTTCIKSEEFFNKVIANNELKEMEFPNLNRLKTVHPLTIVCVPSAIRDRDDDKIDEDDCQLEIANVQVKEEIIEDESFIDVSIDIKSEDTIKNEDICTEDGGMPDNRHTMHITELEHLKRGEIPPARLEQFETGASYIVSVDIKSEDSFKNEGIYPEDDVMSDNRHTKQNTELEHDKHLKNYKILPERIDLKQFKIGQAFAAKNQKLGLLNENIASMMSRNPEIELTVVEDKNFDVRKQSLEKRPVTVKRKKVLHFASQHLHTGEKPYRCNVCGKSFSRLTGLLSHTRLHTGERPYTCDVCQKTFTGRSNFVSHTRIHTGEKPFRCKLCPKSFTQQNGLLSHTRIHTGERPYKCDICQKTFTENSTLVSHMRKHTGEKPYKCDICEQSFSQKSLALIHIRKHTGDNPFKCDICEQSFTRKSGLEKHTRIHTGERPYKCNMCDKSFTQQSGLVRHTLKHTGEKPFKCDMCDQGFTQKIGLIRHTRKHTGEKPYKCDVCEKLFTLKSSLVSHKIKHTV